MKGTAAPDPLRRYGLPGAPWRLARAGAKRRVRAGRFARPGGRAGQAEARRPRRQGDARRGRGVALGMVVVLAAGAVSAWRAGVFPGRLVRVRAARGARAGDGGGDPAGPVGGDAGDRDAGVRGFVPGDRAGRRDADLAAVAGQVIGQGQVLYKTGNGSPVVLLYGSVPDWRTLDEGVTGQDVSQLNHDLVDLGYADRADIVALGWDYYSWETAYAVQRLEEHLGVSWPAGEPVCGAGGVRAGGAAGQPGDGEPGRARRRGRCWRRRRTGTW